MAETAVTSSLHRSPSGWAWAGALGFVYAALYALNFWLPLERGNYATRIWKMAILQLRRNLETAITFHWFTDFARFLFGF